tara:strand:+ start:212 stop:1009 length:798 start_codon:yes stop_codon:yes gene_type:complete
MDKTTEITKDSVIVLTPFGSPMGWVNYFMALMKLREECRDNDVKLNYFFEKNASLITHARNDMVNNFLLNTTAEYMIFIDSDVEFDPTYVVKWVKEKRDFASGTYPIKKYEPELINNLIDMGLKKWEDIEPKSYKYAVSFTDDMVKAGIKIKDGMLVTERVATGFMFISRKLLLEMIEKADTMPSSYNFNAYNLENSYANIKGQVGYTFFDCMMLGDRAIGEDYAFCERLKFIGQEILVDPNIKLNHWGFNSYNGHLVRKFKENE